MGNAEATRERILEAATAEFAAHGIAGGRVDRIAAAAAANKNLIYVYFGSKEQLFSAVLERHLNEIYDVVLFTPEDLPDYAGRLFDFVMEHTNLVRLLAWFGLEQDMKPQEEWSVEPRANLEVKLKGIRKAQRDGKVVDAFTPASMLTMVIALSSAWTSLNPLASFIDPDATKQHTKGRKALVKAVQRLCCTVA